LSVCAVLCEQKGAATQIEGKRAVDGDRGKDDLDALEGLRPEHLLVDREIAFRTGAKPTRELVVGDEGRAVLLERRVAEHMVGMHMRVDHVADRLARHRTDGVAQIAPNLGAAQGVDHSDRVGAYDEARIRHVAPVLRGLDLIASLMHEHARPDLVHRKRRAHGRGETGRDGLEQRRCRKGKGSAKEALAREQKPVRGAMRLRVDIRLK